MKDIFVPLLLIIAAIGGIAWWSMRGDSVRTNPPARAVAVTPAPEPKLAPAHPHPVKRKESSEGVSKSSSADMAAILPAPATVVPQSVPLPVLPFPTVEQIPSGAQEERIFERYGDPVLSATTSDHDHVFETLVYARDQGQSQTVIRVEDGKVLAAYSQTMPPPIQPVSTQRVRH